MPGEGAQGAAAVGAVEPALVNVRGSDAAESPAVKEEAALEPALKHVRGIGAAEPPHVKEEGGAASCASLTCVNGGELAAPVSGAQQGGRKVVKRKFVPPRVSRA